MEFYTFDDAYVARLCAGDRFTEEHFRRYFDELLQIKLGSRVRSQQAIDDIRQEVFLRVFRTICSPDGLRDGRKLGAFVCGVCKNVLFESFRENGRTEALGEEHEQVPDDSVDVVTALLTVEKCARVWRVLDCLAAKDRELLTAVFLNERDKDEVCHSFGVDRNYLRVLLHRAKEKFRSEYGPPDAPTFPSK